jgi:hypothetical protein
LPGYLAGSENRSVGDRPLDPVEAGEALFLTPFARVSDAFALAMGRFA